MSYIRSIERALGLDESESTAERLDVKDELKQEMRQASPEALRKALAALRNADKSSKD